MADQEKLVEKLVKFLAREYTGVEVFKRGAPKVPLLNESDIQPGDLLLVPTLAGTFEMTAKQDENGKIYAEAEDLVAYLAFGEDDRHCWVTTGAANMRAIKKLKFSVTL